MRADHVIHVSFFLSHAHSHRALPSKLNLHKQNKINYIFLWLRSVLIKHIFSPLIFIIVSVFDFEV